MTEHAVKPRSKSFHLPEAIQRGNIFAGACPTRDVLKHVTGTWGIIVLAALTTEKVHRFSELRKKIGGISEKMLTQTLQQLERDGFVLRTMHPVVPPHVDYELTQLGNDMASFVVPLADFIQDNIGLICQRQATFDLKKSVTERWNQAK